ncbi:MAG: DUF4249 domain-containing protein [Gemmatimonadaceae bacterium]|jgi:hypothetical protein|nr:DUF4249 domain-containing protein [Gemmatimonadaceae bacterium]
MMLAACERVVGISVDPGPELLAVEARLEAVREAPAMSRQVFVLSTTAPYFRNEALPPARGATVRVRDERGRTVLFRESATRPGHYETDSLIARAGGVYTLQIEWRGDRYEGTDSLPRVIVPIDTLYFAPRPRANPSVDGVRATIALRDPLGPNFYAWDQVVDGVRLLSPDTTFRQRVIISDEFIEGVRTGELQPYELRRVNPGQMVTVRQLALSRQTFRYLTALNEQMLGDGSPFSAPPANFRGNVANLTRPDVAAVGTFMAVGISERSARVP